MLFKSAYYHSLAEKNRVFIAAKFRDALGEEFVIFRRSEKCLYVYTKEGFEKVSRQFMNTNNREIQRAFFSQVVDMTADKQGRITLTSDLLEHADLTKDVAIIGAGPRIEIWATENYKVDVKPLSELINFDDFTF
jgi:MraZ protein